MRQRGRKSAASLSVVSAGGVAKIERPEPPEELTDEQASEWLAVVERLPADWFPRETHGLLSQYCRHVVASRRVSNLIDNCEASDPLDIDEYDKLLKMQEREGRAMSSLATRLRITQQSSTNHRGNKKKMVPKPWED
mgnify:CR=1 FL=1